VHTVNRELKLALIIGFSLVLLVTVLISDHLSKARGVRLATPDVTPNLVKASEPTEPISGLPGMPLPTQAASGQSNTKGGLAMENAEAAPTGPTLPPPERSISTLDQIPNGLRRVDLNPPASGVPHNEIDAAKRDGRLIPTLTPEPEPIDVTPRKPDPAKTPAGPAMREYVVAEGDSMVKIAKKLLGDASKWNLIAQANPKSVGKKGEVRVGTKLQIPVLDSPIARGAGVKIVDPLMTEQSKIDVGPSGKVAISTPTKKTAKSDARPDAKKPEAKTYTVRPGDTLHDIAKRLLGSASRTEDLLRANPSLESADEIQAGDVLKLPMS
jgi:LysM repeat protein